MRSRQLIILICVFSAKILSAQPAKYSNTTELGLLIKDYNKASVSFQTFNGVRIAHLAMEFGITAGVDKYSPITVLPLSLGFKWNPAAEMPVSAVLSLNAGYGFTWLENSTRELSYSGGHMLNPAFGLRFRNKNESAWSLGAGYKYQEAVVANRFYRDGSDDFNETKDEFKFRRVVVNLGYTFK